MENAAGRLYVQEAFAGESKHVVMFLTQFFYMPSKELSLQDDDLVNINFILQL